MESKSILFSRFQKKLHIFNPIFTKIETKNIKERKGIKNQLSNTLKVATFSIIIIGLLFIIKTNYFEKLDKPKKHIGILNTIIKCLINLKKSKIWPLLRLSDNEIIWNIGVGCERESIGQGRSYVDRSINISNCFFTRYLTYSGWGGIINVYVSSCSMNINFSIFYDCVCSMGGGAICFISSYSCLRMRWANSCSAASYHFSWIQAPQMNHVEFLSVSNCSHTTSGYYSIELAYGDQRVDNTNSSMNNAIEGSCIRIYNYSSFESSYCTFSNNKVNHSICIYIRSSSGTTSISYANIVHNNSPSYYGVVIVSGAYPKMMNCIFHNNQNFLFCVHSGTLEVSHSFISHSVSSFSTSTTVSISNNNSFTVRITYQLQFFNSLHCNSDMPQSEQKQMITFDQTYLKSFSFVHMVNILFIS